MTAPSIRRRTLAAVAVAVTGAVGVLAAAAGAADREQVRLSAAGQTAARAAILTRGDLGAAGAWTGGARKPNLSATLSCPGFEPKQSDLTLIGAAESVWTTTGLQLESEAQVLRTPAMVRLDWQRTVLAPEVMPCLRTMLAGQLGAGSRLVSLQRLAFPQVATYTRAYRALVDVQKAAANVRVLVDLVLVGRGRTEITLTTIAPSAAAQVVQAAELRLARALASRVRM